MLAKQIESAKTLASNFQTSAIRIETTDNVGFFIYCSSVTDNTGSFAAEVRPYKDDNTVGEDWIPLSLDTTPILNNADDDFFISLNQLPTCQVRLNFTAAGSVPDGTCNIWISATEA
jgi:hypothetical protein